MVFNSARIRVVTLHDYYGVQVLRTTTDMGIELPRSSPDPYPTSILGEPIPHSHALSIAPQSLPVRFPSSRRPNMWMIYSGLATYHIKSTKHTYRLLGLGRIQIIPYQSVSGRQVTECTGELDTCVHRTCKKLSRYRHPRKYLLIAKNGISLS